MNTCYMVLNIIKILKYYFFYKFNFHYFIYFGEVYLSVKGFGKMIFKILSYEDLNDTCNYIYTYVMNLSNYIPKYFFFQFYIEITD
jgi:hypothetical protein